MSIKNIQDDRRRALAIFIAVFIVFAWMQINQKPLVIEKPVSKSVESVSEVVAAPAQPQIIENKSIVVTNNNQAEANTNVPAVDPVLSTGVTVDYESAPRLVIDSPLYKAKFNLLGGRLESWQLKEHFKTIKKKEPLELITIHGERAPLALQIGGLSDAASLYQIVGSSKAAKNNKITLNSGEELNLRLQGTLANGVQVDKVFKFNADSYLFDLDAKLSKPTIDGSKVQLKWYDLLAADFTSDRYNRKSVFYKPGDSAIEREIVDGKSHELVQATAQYVGLGDNYFMSSFVVPSGIAAVQHQTLKNDRGGLISYSLFGDNSVIATKVYIGPKEPKLLQNLGYDLYKSVDYGWFAVVGKPINSLIDFCYSLLGNYGLAIILVTILIKLFLLPLTKKSYLSMSAMSKLQPEMAAIRERVKDPAVMQQEMLKLYQKNGVNPLGGCLPMLLQIPVFLGMYNALQTSVYLRHADFALWIDDLASPEKLMILGIPVPVMILLMGASMFLQTMLTPTAADPNQKKIMYMMPVMFTVMFIIFPFPSGLVLYWLVNNIMSIIQQYAIRTERNIQPLQATIVAGIFVFGSGYLITLI